MPKVSIVIPTYERAKYLERLLGSVCGQTFRDYEVIVIDDCSTDIESYAKVIREYEHKINRLIYLRNDVNFGSPTHARNVGMKLSKGEYVAFCDDDDEWYPDKLQKQVDKFEKSPVRYGLVYTWADTIDGKTGEVIFKYRGDKEGNFVKELLKKDFIPTSSVMVRKEEFLAINGMDESMIYCCEDWDAWLRMLKNGTLCGVVKEVLLRYYRWEGECFSMSPKMVRGYIQFYRKHFWYALGVSPVAAFSFLKHLASIYVRQGVKLFRLSEK